jgi:hypothetical protein
MPRDTQVLHDAVAAVCPIEGLSVGDWSDKTTWVIWFAAQATAAEKLATRNVVNNFDPAGPAATAEETYRAKIAAGLAMTWTVSTALNGTYSVGPDTVSHVSAEKTSIQSGGTFASGAATMWLVDMANTSHVFDTTQFTAFASAILRYVSILNNTYAQARAGQTVSWPTGAATIPG